MQELHELLKWHQARHPAMQLGDAVKLVYQNEFGGGHLIADPQAALARLKQELSGIAQRNDLPLWEPLGNRLARFNLAALAQSGLSSETLNALFVWSAQRIQGSTARFEEKLRLLRQMIADGELHGLSVASFDAYLADYRRAGFPPVSHTPAYREAEAPAYRVLSMDALTYLPFFAAADALPNQRLLIGIDGRCASGKSTLGELAAHVYQANLLHMDDFFLPFERKTSERLSQPGGNVDYERFAQEVLAKLTQGVPFRFRPYRCHPNPGYAEPIEVPDRRVSIVEGTYAHHPYFKQPYQLTVFLTTDPATQSARILRRNGEEMHQRFVSTWIPLEEAYFGSLRIAEKADLRLET